MTDFARPPAAQHDDWCGRIMGVALVGSAGLLVLIWTLIGLQVTHERQQAFADAERDIYETVQLITLHSEAALKRADDVLRLFRDDATQGRALDLFTRANRLNLVDDMILQIAWAEADGRVVESSIAAGPTKVSIADRAHFRIHQTHPDTGVFMSQTLRGRVSQRWSIQLSRAARMADGKLLGVLVASVDPTYFIGGLGRVPMRHGDVIAIIGDDGYLRIRVPSTEDFETRAQLPPEMMNVVKSLARQQAVAARSPIDGIERLYRAMPIPHFGANVLVGRSLDDIEARRRAAIIPLFSIGAVGSVIIVVFVGLLLGFARRQHRANRALEAARAEARAASEAKSYFLENISHELSAPLEAIMGFSKIISEDILESHKLEDHQEYIKDIYQNTSYLHNLISSILDLSKIELGHVNLKFERIDLGEVAAMATQIARGMMPNNDVTIDNRLVQGTMHVRADHRALQQILLNLILNSLKHTSSGGTIILCASEQNKRVTIDVVDTGVDIIAEQFQSMFAPLQPADPPAQSEGAHNAPAKGLGLLIIKSLVDLHGGSLTLSCTVGHGTNARVCLPAA